MRLRNVAAVARGLVVTAIALVLEHVDELMLAFGLGLVALGFRAWWLPGAYLVPGAVVVWMYLPKRTAFFERSPQRRRED